MQRSAYRIREGAAASHGRGAGISPEGDRSAGDGQQSEGDREIANVL